MNAVLEWVKNNVFIVVFAVLMLAAAVALPIMSSGMNQSVRDMVQERSQNLSTLTQLEKSEVLPGQVGIPNETSLRRYEEVSRIVADDAAAVQKAALEHNRKGRGVIMAEMFPEPPAAMMDVMPARFHDALMDAYGNLLAEVGAGMPPDLETLRQDLELVRNQFITQDLKKDQSEALDPDETKRLTELLTDARMSLHAEAAGKVGMYLSLDQLRVPGFDRARHPGVGEMFNWQWQYWVTEDILRALHAVNQEDRFVNRAPVKQVLDLQVLDLPAPNDAGSPGAAASRGGAAGGLGGGMGGGFGESPQGGGGPGGTPAAPSAAPPNPKAPVPQNFNVSFTGRTSNPLYDVVPVQLVLIVETSRLPLVLDSLAQYNFMTVTGLHLAAVDPFAATEGGFYYGGTPVSQVTLTLETIWLRAWTKDFMPRSIKQALGVPVEQPPPADPAA